MKIFFLGVLIALLGVAAVWLLGRMFLEVQLPERAGRRDAFPDPMTASLSLREAFAALPAEGEERAEIRLLDDNALAWVERWRLLADARERLDICYFILRQDIYGMSFLGHLVKKAGEGVEIRVLLDAMGTRMSRDLRGNDYLDTLVNLEQVQVRMYRPLFFRYLDAFLTLNPAAVFVSDHDKILLADGRKALIGGRNISAEYFNSLADDPLAFRDTDLVLAGAVIAGAAEAAFEAQYESGEAQEVKQEALDLNDATADLLLAYEAMEGWLHGGAVPPPIAAAIRERNLPWLEELQNLPHLRGAIETPLPPPERAEVRLLDSRCRLLAADDFITRSLIRLVRSAGREIFIQSPYLVLPEAAVQVLAEAAGRGVRISILTNSPLSSDNAMSQAVFLEQWPELLARVPGLRLFVAGDRHNLHDKLAVFDRDLTLVGTYNLDPLSMALNSELMAAAWSPAFAEELLQGRERFIAEGEPGVLEYRIARTENGEPRRDRKGRVVVAFGPEDHVPPEPMQSVQRYRRLFRWVWGFRGRFPWL